MSVAIPPPTTRSAGVNAPARGVPERHRFAVRGVVQGVGFRPFVWNLATPRLARIDAVVAPGLQEFGVMLPHTRSCVGGVAGPMPAGFRAGCGRCASCASGASG